jgi:hypothetical protein
MKWLIAIILCIATFGANARAITFTYYCDTVTIDVPPQGEPDVQLVLNDGALRSFYEKLNENNYKVTLDQLQHLREIYQLNDWFYYKLVQNFATHYLIDKNENYQVAFCWFVLNRSGFNANLMYAPNNKLELYAYSEAELFVPYYRVKKKKFYYLKFYPTKDNTSNTIRHLNFFPNRKGRSFDFSLNVLPQLKTSSDLKKTLVFEHKRGKDSISVILNKTFVDAMVDYPEVSLNEYFKPNLSNEADQSINSALGSRIAELPKDEAVRLLLSFVRTFSRYTEDINVFGKDRPMIAEEVLYYPTSDCEDKSALFGQLVNRLLNMQVIVLRYHDHVNVAVLLDDIFGKPFIYKGQKYSVCEPSALVDGANVGIGYSKKYEENPKPAVIFEYNKK